MPLGLDPEIILKGRPAQIEEPLDQLRKVAQLRQEQQNLAMGPARLQNLQADTRLATTRANDAETEAADREAFHAAMVQSGSDPDKMLEIGRNTIRNPAVLSQLENHASEIRKRDAETKGKSHKEFADKARLFADRFQAILETKDPEVQKQMWTDAAAGVNDLKDENGKSLVGGQKLDGSTLPAPEVIQGLQTYADSAAGYHTRLADQKKAKEDQNIKDDADRKREADNRQSQRAEAANLFETVGDQETYTAWRDKLPDGIRGEYPNKYNTVGKDNTPDLVRRKGRTIPQQDQADNRGKDKSNTTNVELAIDWATEHYKGQSRDVILNAALDRISQEQKDAKFPPGSGAKGDKVQQRQWITGYDNAKKDEENLYPQIDQLEKAIARGDTYVKEPGKGDKLGESLPMDKHIGAASKDPAKDTAAAIESMKQRANALRDKVGATIRRKYELADRLGFTGDTPVDEAVGKVLSGKIPVTAGQQAKPFETTLSPTEETAFAKWKAKNAPNDSGEDYDLRGAFKADQAGKLPRDQRGHTTDQFKKPNHPSFSVDSQYSGQNGEVGGRWEEKDGKTTFYASPTNLKYNSPDSLKKYFKENEPDVTLVLPGQQPGGQKNAQPKGQASAPAPAGGEITVKLPNGKFVTGTKDKLDAFMKANHMSWSTPPADK